MNEFRQTRLRHNLKQSEMASKLCISVSHYSKLEGNFVNPSFELLKKLKQVFKETDMNNFF